VTSGRQVKSREAILYGFDLPLNVKYNLSISDYNLFASAGISSTVYFKETVETTYQVGTTVATTSVDENGNPIILVSVVKTYESDVESERPFNKFFFAKIINVSFGIELPIGNNNRSIIIEPYFKYALGSQTSIRIHPSSLGLSFGIVF